MAQDRARRSTAVRRLAVIAAAVVGATYGLSHVPAVAADGATPSLTALSIVGSPFTADVTHGDATVGVLVQATEAGGAGVSDAEVDVSCTSGCVGSGDSTESGYVGEFAGPAANVAGTASIDIPQTAQTGTWQVTQLTLDDNDGDSTIVTGSDLGTSRSFTVSKQADTTPPVLVSLTAAGGNVDVTTADKQVALTAHITDDVAGFDDGTITMVCNDDDCVDQGETKEFDLDTSDLQSGTPLDGTYLTEPDTFGIDDVGDWTVQSVDLDDAYGNDNPTSTSTLSFDVTATPDSTPPSVTGTPSFTPTSTDPTTGDQTVDLTMQIVDTGSGFSDGYGDLMDGDGDEISFSMDPSMLTTGDTYVIPIEVPALQPAGTYSFDDLELYDRAGNFGTPDSFDGWPTLSVTTQTDTAGPQLPAFTASPTPLNLYGGAADRPLTLNADITDDKSGFSYADVYAKDAAGNPQEFGGALQSSQKTSGTTTNGHFVAEIYPQFQTSGADLDGQWTITSVHLFDLAGNENDVPENVHFTVNETNPADASAPTLSALTVTPTSVDTSAGDATVNVSVTVADAGTAGGEASGFSSGYLTLSSPDGTEQVEGYIDSSDLLSGDDTDGTYDVALTIPKYDEPGTWSLTDVELFDSAGNDDYLTGQSLFNVVNTVTVTVTGPIDNHGPQLVSIVADPTSINTTNGSQKVDFTVHATDDGATNDGSGLSGGEILLTSPTGQTTEAEFDPYDDLVSGSATDGTYTTSTRLGKFVDSGTWTISITLDDNVGNESDYSSTDIAAIGGSTSSVDVTAAPDTTAPVVTAIDFTPASVNTASGDQPLIAEVHITDDNATADGSGVDNASLDLASPDGTQPDMEDPYMSLVAGTATDGWWEADFDVPQFVDSGTWKIASLTATDDVGNEASYDQAALSTAGLPTGVSITGPPDSAPPAIAANGVTMPSTPVDVRTANQQMLVGLHLTDSDGNGNPGSGVAYGSVTVTGPNGATAFGYFSGAPDSGVATNGTWQVPVEIDEFTDNGTWHLTDVDVTDVYGNSADLSGADLDGLSTAFTVESNPDTTPPTLTSLSLSPASVDVTHGSANITVTAGVSDAGSGFQDGDVELEGPAPAHEIVSADLDSLPQTGDYHNGTFTGTATIPQYGTPGTWTVISVDLYDAQYNDIDYPSDAAFPEGATTSITVADTDADTTAPAVAGISISPSPVDLSGGQKQVTFDFHLTDDKSGVVSGTTFELRAPNGDVTDEQLDTLTSGSPTDGHWQLVVPFGTTSENGTWKIDDLEMFDAAGNETTATNAELPATSSFSVTGGTSVKPGAPTDVSGTAGNASVDLSWDAPSDDGGSAITGYHVQKSSDGGTTWTDVTGDGFDTSTATSGTVTGLTNGTSYVFRVAAINAVGTGSYSSPSSTLTPQATATAPHAPTGVAGVGHNASVALTWTAPSDNGGSSITGYHVQKSSDGGSTWTDVTGDGFDTSTATSGTVTGLTNGTSYVFRVAAINAVGTGSYSTQSEAVTPATTPAAPTGLSGTAGDTTVDLSWTAPSVVGGSPITGYNVQDSTDGGSTWTDVTGDGFDTSTATSGTVTGLTNGTSYVFRVAAINAVGTGAYTAASSPLMPISASATVPGAPTAVAGTAGDGSVALSWTAPADDGGAPITGYNVQDSTDGGSTWTDVTGDGFDSSAATSGTVTGLTNGTSYVFQVAAINGKGQGAYSSPSASVTPKAAAPDASTLSIGKSTTISEGRSTTLATSLKDARTHAAVFGVTVVLASRQGTTGSFHTVATRTTNGSGSASASVKPTANTQYVWAFAGTSTHLAAVSAVRTVSVAQVVKASAAAKKVKHGKKALVYGTVSPNEKGQKVVLQQLVHGKWKTLHVSATIKKQKLPNHKKTVGYVLSLKEKKKGTFSYRVSRAATKSNAAGFSAKVTVKVT